MTPPTPPGPVLVPVPHRGTGTHTLVVALEIPDELLDDPAGQRAAVARIATLARRELAALTTPERRTA